MHEIANVDTHHRNPVIDGWRGVSVLLVVVGHLVGYRLGSDFFPHGPIRAVLDDPVALAGNLGFRVASGLGEIGVSVFFLISGFLISSLLLHEERRNGRVSIAAFYTRRAFRILPAFVLYLITVFILARAELILVNQDAFAKSGLFVCNIYGFDCSWWLGHTWSLSVEEQFYIFWPLAFMLLAHRRTFGIAMITAMLMMGSLIYPGLGSFAHIAIGALVALWPAARALVTRIATTRSVVAAAGLVVLKPLLFPLPALAAAVHFTQPLLIAIMFFGTLFNASGGLLRALVANRLLARIGLVSYSLYLWQQLSLGPLEWGGRPTGSLALYEFAPVLMGLAFLPAAILSYRFVELPMIFFGRALSKRITARGIEPPRTPREGPNTVG